MHNYRCSLGCSLGCTIKCSPGCTIKCTIRCAARCMLTLRAQHRPLDWARPCPRQRSPWGASWGASCPHLRSETAWTCPTFPEIRWPSGMLSQILLCTTRSPLRRVRLYCTPRPLPQPRAPPLMTRCAHLAACLIDGGIGIRKRPSLSIPVPVLLAHGSGDIMTCHEASREFVSRLQSPDKTFRSFPDAFHSCTCAATLLHCGRPLPLAGRLRSQSPTNACAPAAHSARGYYQGRGH